jgi:hypothetical protein
MAQIYNHDSKKLNDLLSRAGIGTDATLLIPDLQRPYVWKPSQVTLLVDSLLRGWPFGTLLLWEAHQDDLAQIPARTFWKVVDLTDDESGETVTRQNPPGGFQMVLDGQQRLQSLLLALGGDSWGFKLYDREWSEDLLEKRARGRRGLGHWSVGTLCFDLTSFAAQTKRGVAMLEFEYREVLRWVITDPAGGQSKLKPADVYQSPLPRSFDPQNRGRFVRFSRLWSLARPDRSIKESAYRGMLQPFLASEGVEKSFADSLLAPLAELMTTLSDVKVNEVAYLEVSRFDPLVSSQEVYNDAVVNIFTRLNTAGRTLTREEITFAWLKIGWDQKVTGGRTAIESFDRLRDDLAGQELVLETDELVSAVSLVWSAAFGTGAPLSNKDLLRGETVRPMAQQLSQHWNLFTTSAHEVAVVLNSRELRYGEIFRSANSLAILWGVAFAGLRWAQNRGLGVVARDDFDKRLTAALARATDRWLICSQWAKRWAEATGATVEKYVKDLAALVKTVDALTDLGAVIKAIEQQLAGWNSELEPDALSFVSELRVTKRESVSAYYVPLWVWHRLDARRWSASAIQLRENKQKKLNYDVDHVVAFGLWNDKIAVANPALTADQIVEFNEVVNLLGNTFLLEKSFNIVKGKHSLGHFLKNVHEFVSGAQNRDDWGAALSLLPEMIDSDTNPLAELRRLIEERTKTMKNDLEGFVRGSKTRVDVV